MIKKIKKLIKKIFIIFLGRSLKNKEIIKNKLHQIELFNSLYSDILKYKIESSLLYSDNNWASWSDQFKNIYKNPDDLIRFSENPVIIRTMVGEVVLDRTRDVVPYIDKLLDGLYMEELIGNQIILNKHKRTSSPRLGHLYVASIIKKYLAELNYEPKKIIEIGGGFGGLMSILLRINKELDFIIFDLPEFLPLQYIYINSVVRIKKEDAVYDFSHFKNIDLIGEDNCKNSLLISNWALTESNIKLQNYALKSNFWGAEIAIICCEHNNKSFESSTHMHNYLKEKAKHIIPFQVYGLSNSSMYIIDYR